MQLHLPAAIAALSLSTTVGAIEPTWPDLVYGDVGGTAMHVDLYLPLVTPGDSGPVPVVVYVHGGGWLAGDRYPLPASIAPLVDEGIAVAAVEYRLTSQAWRFGGEPVTFPGQIHDVKGAVRWLRANAEAYGLDPERFGAWGQSAGGHLAALLGTSGDVPELEGAVGGNAAESSRVLAVVDEYGPTNLLLMNPDRTFPPGGIDHDLPDSAESRFVGWVQPGQGIGDIRANLANPAAPYPQLVTLCAFANPVTHVTADDAEHFIAHGTMDTMVPVAQSARLAGALDDAGVGYEYHPVEGQGHASLGPEIEADMIRFLVTRLRPTPGDANRDGQVDITDLLSVLGAWGPCTGCPEDLDGSGRVDVFDLLVVLSNWG